MILSFICKNNVNLPKLMKNIIIAIAENIVFGIHFIMMRGNALRLFVKKNST